MSAILDNAKTFGSMAKGQIAPDRVTARAAAIAMATGSAQSVALVTPQKDDPQSEASPAIRVSFDDFLAMSMASDAVATGLSQSFTGLEDVMAAMGAPRATCKTCSAFCRA